MAAKENAEKKTPAKVEEKTDNKSASVKKNIKSSFQREKWAAANFIDSLNILKEIETSDIVKK